MKIKNMKKLRKPSMILFFVMILFFLVLLNSINYYIIWEEQGTTQVMFDRFSIGHIISGIVICMTTFLVLMFMGHKFSMYSILITLGITSIILIMWEFLENSQIYISLGLKYNNMQDSFLNMTTDVFLGMFGAGLVAFVFWKVIIRNKRNEKKA